jgi:acetoin utilization protein AcuC
MTKDNLYVAYGDVYLDWRLGKSHPTNPERAQIAVELLKRRGIPITMVEPIVHSEDAHNLINDNVHSADYVRSVLDGYSDEWLGCRPDLGATALAMYAGTARLVELMLRDEARVAFNPQGAKHHAQYRQSSGFCVFNDMAWAARVFGEVGMRVLYVDWDAHHGDGVEALLRDSQNLVTASIHDGEIWPGTGLAGHDVAAGAYNWALRSGSGDDKFIEAMADIEMLADSIRPDVVLLATGADGHVTDPLSTIEFDYPGYRYAAETIANIATRYSEGRVLIGGAGGYQPHTHTPKIWDEVVSSVHAGVVSKLAVS